MHLTAARPLLEGEQPEGVGCFKHAHHQSLEGDSVLKTETERLRDGGYTQVFC